MDGSDRVTGGDRTPWLLTVPVAFTGAVALLLAAAPTLPVDPGTVLLLAVAAIAAVLPVAAVLRLPAQLLVVVATAASVLAAGWRPLDVLWSLLGLAAVVLVVDRAGAVLGELHAEQATERIRLERRLDLLAAMEDLPDTHDEAVAATVRILRELGFDAAGVSFVRDGMLHAELLDGVGDPGPLPIGRGLAGRALVTGRTVVTADYVTHPDRLEDITGDRAVVVAPVRVDDRPIGVVMCDRHAVGAPTDAEVEIAEVLAAHLGGVLTTLERRRRQSELLRRATRLDELRSQLIAAVSEDVRLPIAEVRRAVAALAAQVPKAEPPEAELARLRTAAAELAATITAVLSVARRRLQSTTGDAEALHLRDLVAAVEQATGTTARWSPEPAPHPDDRVRLVPALCLHGVELIVDGFGGPGAVAVTVTATARGPELRLTPPSDLRPPPVVVGLATQLLAAAGVELAVDAPAARPTPLRLQLVPPPEEELG